MQRWESLIDEACKACGSQNKLAIRLGITGPNMSQARHGQRRLTTDQVAQMAEILGVPAADVWLAQEDYRNPFRVVETAAVAILAALFLFTLPSESRASARVCSGSAAIAHEVSQTDSLYIVDITADYAQHINKGWLNRCGNGSIKVPHPHSIN